MAATNAATIAAQLSRVGPLALLAVQRVVRQHGLLLEARIKANASGRPGPNAPTGDYRGSWSTEFSGGAVGGSVSTRATVGTNKPQARRLEYGFVGADVLGRVYNQAPRPHVQPAVDAVGPQFASAMERAVGDAVESA